MKVTVLSQKELVGPEGFPLSSIEFTARWEAGDLDSADWEFPRFTDSARAVLAEYLAVRGGWRRLKGYYHLIPEAGVLFAKAVDERVVLVEE